MIGKRSIYIIAATLAAIIVFARVCLCATNFAVSPPAASASDNTNGTPRTFPGILLPNGYAADKEVVNPQGSYSNKVYFYADAPSDCPYTLRIKMNTDLSSGTHTLPASCIRYMYTYGGNITFGIPAQGTKLNFIKFVYFSTSYQDVYISGTTGTYEIPASSGFPIDKKREWEHQFLYDIIVPNNAWPGTYTGTITYRVDPAGTERTATISVTIGELFTLTVDRGQIDFENMSPGTTKDNVPVEGVVATSNTNTGRPWFLKISNDSPLSSGPYVIPNSNFIWYGWTDGSGTWYGNGTDAINLVPSLMYAGGANETNNLPDGTKNHIKFKLSIPKGQPGGKYISNVKLTLTE